MRVKMSAKEYGVKKFEFGKKYFIAYVGTSLSEQFVFTRKKMIEMCEIDGLDQNRKVSSYWISKRELKQLLRLELIHFMSEIKEK